MIQIIFIPIQSLLIKNEVFNMETGKFIVLEGIDGSGTSTQAQLLTNYLFLKDKKNAVLLTREPTKLSPYGQELRRRLVGQLLPGEEVIDDPDYWASLFVNDRRWHLDKMVIPSLQLGQQVVSDRHKLSTIAYQSAQGKDIDALIKMHDGMYVPDLTLLLNINVETARHRMGEDATRTQEYFDGVKLQRKIRDNYLLATQKLGSTEYIVVIDGSQSIDDVAKAIQQKVNKLYGYK